MIYAVDTNVLVALLSGTESEAEAAQNALSGVAQRGVITISPVVYAELMAMPGLEPDELGSFLADTDVTVHWALGSEVWRAAGRAYSGYARRRRRQQGDAGPRRILADFAIGAHALYGGRAAYARPRTVPCKLCRARAYRSGLRYLA